MADAWERLVRHALACSAVGCARAVVERTTARLNREKALLDDAVGRMRRACRAEGHGAVRRCINVHERTTTMCLRCGVEF